MTDTEFLRSRRRFVFWGCISSSIYSLTAGAFIAGFAKYLGADDRFNGIIMVLPAFAGVVQILSPLVFERLSGRKTVISALALFYGFMLGSMLFIPMISKGQGIRLAMLAVVYFTANCALSFINPAIGSWLADLTPNQIRGKYFGRKESYGIAFSTIITLTAGKVMDMCKGMGKEYAGFLAVFSFAALLAAINFNIILRIREPEHIRSSVPLNLFTIITTPLKNTRFRKVILLNVFWYLSLEIAGPYAAVYMVTGLKLDYAYIALVGLVGSVTQAVFTRIWGRFADRLSWHFTTKAAVGLFVICHFIWFLINRDTAFILIPVIQVLGGITWGCTGISFFNLQLKHAGEEIRTAYLGFNAAIGGITGFISTIIGAALLWALKGFKGSFGSFAIGNIQMLFGISTIMMLACFIYTVYTFRNTM